MPSRKSEMDQVQHMHTHPRDVTLPPSRTGCRSTRSQCLDSVPGSTATTNTREKNRTHYYGRDGRSRQAEERCVTITDREKSLFVSEESNACIEATNQVLGDIKKEATTTIIVLTLRWWHAGDGWPDIAPIKYSISLFDSEQFRNRPVAVAAPSCLFFLCEPFHLTSLNIGY